MANVLDAGALHLLSVGSLSWLQANTPEGVVDARRFRPNLIVIAHGNQPELKWLGKHLRIGGAELRVTATTERCGMVAFAQNELPEAPQVFRHIVQENDAMFGVYAEVVRPGTIRLGDAVAEIEIKEC